MNMAFDKFILRRMAVHRVEPIARMHLMYAVQADLRPIKLKVAQSFQIPTTYRK